MKAVAGTVALLAVISFGVWFQVAAPCSWHSFQPSKEIPGRCLTVVKK